MVDEKKVEEKRKETLEEWESDGNTTPVILLLIVVPVLVVSCTLLYFFASYQAKPDNNTTIPIEIPVPEVITSTTEQQIRKNVTISSRPIQLQPNCTIGEYFKEFLNETSVKLYFKTQLCTPEDIHNLAKHDMPNLASNNNKVSEPKGHFVIYIAVGLLLTSLLAALVDVYKVKGKPSKAKPQLTKRCSLADLTVLRHSRRESMKKDSYVEEQRGPLKLLDQFPT